MRTCLLAFVREFSWILRTAFSHAIPQNSHCITPVALFSLTASSDLLDSLSDIGLDASEEVVDSSHFSGNRQRTYLDKDFLISSDLVEDRAAEVSGKEEDCNDDGGGARVLTDTSKEGKEGTERGREGADVDAESQNDRERAREGEGPEGPPEPWPATPPRESPAGPSPEASPGDFGQPPRIPRPGWRDPWGHGQLNCHIWQSWRCHHDLKICGEQDLSAMRRSSPKQGMPRRRAAWVTYMGCWRGALWSVAASPAHTSG